MKGSSCHGVSRSSALATLLFPLVLACSAEAPAATAEEDPFSHEKMLNITSPAEADPEALRGLHVLEAGAFEGVTLIWPLSSTEALLVDMQGEVVHRWETGSAPGAWAYLLDDGTLLVAGREDDDPEFKGGGIGGRMRRLAPDGEVLWSFDLAGEDRQQHHDLEPLPNGNLLLITWERKSREEALARGADTRPPLHRLRSGKVYLSPFNQGRIDRLGTQDHEPQHPCPDKNRRQ